MPESRSTASALLQKLDEGRRRWNKALQSINFTNSNRRAWSIIDNLTGRSRHPPRQRPISANAIASQLIRNGKYMMKDRETTRLVREETSELWKISTPDGSFLTREFSSVEIATALQKLKSDKTPGPDQICPELILHAGPIIKSWLYKFLSSCLCQLRISKVWRRSLVVAIPKPNKPLDDAKSYRQISLLCIPHKIFERLIYTRIEPIIEPLLPQEQAGFQRGRSTVDQVALIAKEIEEYFLSKKKAGAVFVDLTAAYDTVWHHDLACKLLQLIPDRH